MVEIVAILNYLVVAVVFSLLVGSGFSQKARVNLVHVAFPLLIACVVFRAARGGEDLAKELAWYASYHSHPMNQMIHLVCVPLLLATVMVFAAYVPPPLPKLAPRLTWPLVAALAWTAHHVRVDSFVGGLVSALTLGMAFAATRVVEREKTRAGAFGRAAAYACVLHLLGWYAQIHPGHGVFEGRKPALLESVLQAFLDAPLFVWYEALFYFGYEPELKAQLDAAVAAQHAAWATA